MPAIAAKAGIQSTQLLVLEARLREQNLSPKSR
jgi:hypothetical protein